jgi:hypothetical protein
LNTQEEIDAWLAERKNRFPTANRIAEKKAKIEDAIARGQLPFDPNPRSNKRPRLEEPNRGAHRGRGNGRGRGRKTGPPNGRVGVVSSKVSTTPIQTGPNSLPLRSPLPVQPPVPVPSEDCDSSDSDDSPPKPLSTKSMKNFVPESPPQEASRDSERTRIKPSMGEKPSGSRRPAAQQPRGPPPIPFGQNTSLLRNVRPYTRKVNVGRSSSVEPALIT